ncbi:hypothetical protein ACRALDRAFT_1082203 [Sodiomyces alcalophilus JCM 7366]|uniref:uncharacterized protein n=1 Tax=Sodiomyces alcalophilus JCM 7366 TaxID=591952 RepID=UPI0039B3A1BE
MSLSGMHQPSSSSRPYSGPLPRGPKIPRLPVDKRHRPLITPSDPEWPPVEQEFRELLNYPSVTIGQLLDEYFTPHEKRLVIPAVVPASLAHVQAENTKRFKRLLAVRFRGHTITLATKFAMLWFGLPVEPLLPQLFDHARYQVDTTDDLGLQEIEVRPPLHFLTAHDQRNYGKEELSGRESGFSTIPVPVSSLHGSNEVPRGLSLRGGGGDDHEDDDEHISISSDVESEDVFMSDDAELEPDEDETSNEQGGALDGAFEDQAVDADDEQHETPTSSAQPGPGTLTLYGYQGRIRVDVKQRQSAQAAIRSLLCLRPAEDAEVVLRKLDKNSGQVKKTIGFFGHQTAPNEAVDYILENDPHSYAWFVHRGGEMAPSHYQPQDSTAGTVVELLLDGKDERVAYWRQPSSEICDPDGEAQRFGFNHYMPFVKTAQDVLFGYPERGEVKIHANVSYSDPSDSGDDTDPWYSGLGIAANYLQWALYPPSKGVRKLVVKCQALKRGEVVFHVPGNAKTQGLYKSLPPYRDCLSRLRELRSHVFPANNVRKFLIWRGVDYYWSPDPHAVARPLTWDPRERDEAKVDQFVRSLQAFMRGYADQYGDAAVFLVLQPLYDEKEGEDGTTQTTSILRFPGSKGAISRTPLPEDLTSTTEFLRIFLQAYESSSTGASPKLDLSRTQIMLWQGKDGKPGSDQSEDGWEPHIFVVDQDTPNEEMALIRRLLVGRVIDCSIVKGEEDVDNFIQRLREDGESHGAQTVWGPRYGMIDGWRREKMGLRDIADGKNPWTNRLREEYEERRRAEAASREAESQKANISLPRSSLRELSWARPLSIYDSGTYNPSIPINAPPLEQMLRTGDGGVPMVSKAVLTPTEQRQLLKEYNELRNLNIQRIYFCQYRHEGCKRLKEHLEKKHIASKCPWCRDPLYEYQTPEQKRRHFKEKHGDELRAILDVQQPQQPLQLRQRQDPSPSAAKLGAGNQEQQNIRTQLKELFAKPRSIFEQPADRPSGQPMAPSPPARANSKESEFYFCDRCGRDHGELTDAADRAHHDRRCVPQAEGAGHCTFCEACGDYVWNTGEDAARWEPYAQHPHACKGISHPGKPHCTKCGLSMAKFSDEYVDKHRIHCRGFSRELGCFCPYCRESFENMPGGDQKNHDESLTQKNAHIQACRDAKVPAQSKVYHGSMTPFDLYPPEYWAEPVRPHDSLYDGPVAAKNRPRFKAWRPSRRLRYPLAWYDKPGPNPKADPPIDCPQCRDPLIGLRPLDVIRHFEEKHGPGPLQSCPFCELSFRERQGNGAEEGQVTSRRNQALHMECHIFELWTLLLAQNPAAANDVRLPRPQPAGAPFSRDHPLYNPEEVGMDRRHKRCPLFEVCGAMVGFMTAEQWATHMKESHGSEDFSIATDAEIEAQKWTIERARQLWGTPAAPGISQGPQGNPAPSNPPGDAPGNAPVTPQPDHPPVNVLVNPPERPVPNPPPTPQPNMTPNQPAIPPVTPISTGHGNDDHGHILVDQHGNFMPSEDMYCSRCFRKVPKKSGVKAGEPFWREQIEAHSDPNRSCRIPPQQGTVTIFPDGTNDLPNRTGWIHKPDLPGQLKQLRRDWVKKHKGYSRTIYPIDGHWDRTMTMWKFDPNHPDNKEYWGLPFPLEGDTDDEGDDEHESEDDSGDDSGDDQGDEPVGSGGPGAATGKGSSAAGAPGATPGSHGGHKKGTKGPAQGKSPGKSGTKNTPTSSGPKTTPKGGSASKKAKKVGTPKTKGQQKKQGSGTPQSKKAAQKEVEQQEDEAEEEDDTPEKARGDEEELSEAGNLDLAYGDTKSVGDVDEEMEENVAGSISSSSSSGRSYDSNSSRSGSSEGSYESFDEDDGNGGKKRGKKRKRHSDPTYKPNKKLMAKEQQQEELDKAEMVSELVEEAAEVGEEEGNPSKKAKIQTEEDFVVPDVPGQMMVTATSVTGSAK